MSRAAAIQSKTIGQNEPASLDRGAQASGASQASGAAQASGAISNGRAAPAQPDAVVGALQRQLRLSSTVAEWLAFRGLTSPQDAAAFLNPRLSELTPPDEMLDRETAASRIAQAVANGERIVVFGDYDCDGITSAAILTEVLRTLGNAGKSGSADVVPLLASRFDGGYGLSSAATDRVIAAKPSLLVTCDCGSSDHESLERVAAAGIDAVVIDHHLVPEQPLPVVAFLNPHRPGCGFPYKGLASCGLVLSLAAALRKKLNVALDVRKWLDLVAIGTIADVAPLDGDNRALVRAGLAALQRADRPGVAALLSLAKVSTEAPLTARDVAFRIAPHINAPGRMGPPDLALDLLLAPDEQTAAKLAEQIEQVSGARRQLQEQMTEQACAEITERCYDQQPAIVLGREGWNHGIVGIVAGRLSDQFQRPVVVIGFEPGEASGRGSVRGPAGSQLHSALAACSESLVRFGGHQAAAGLEIEPERLQEFRERFVHFARQGGSQATNLSRLGADAAPSSGNAASAGSGGEDSAKVDAVSDVPAKDDVGQEDSPGEHCWPARGQDDPTQLLADLDRLEPCGHENPRPRLQFNALVTQAREVSGGHLKLELRLDGGRHLGGFAVAKGDAAKELDGARVRVVGDLRHNVYGGVDRPEVFVEDISVGDVR